MLHLYCKFAEAIEEVVMITNCISYRQDVLAFALEQYGTEPEYLWSSAPAYAVLRHRNGKWYGIVMDVPREKLGLSGQGCVDVLNVKCEPELIGAFRQRDGFLPAYHMNRSHWLTVLLDGTGDRETSVSLLDMSYDLIEKGTKKRGRLRREPK